MTEAISKEWCVLEESGSYSPAIGGYMAKKIDNYDLLEEIGFVVSDQILMGDICDAFGDHDWCARNWEELSPGERFVVSWESFQHFVKHDRRYTFWYAPDYGDGGDPYSRAFYSNSLPPPSLLAEIAPVLNSTNLVRSMPVGTVVWRLRDHLKNEVPSVPHGFTSPPQDKARSNRMSPAGVPMFYGADDFETAQAELDNPGHAKETDRCVSGLQFKNVVPLNMLDLTAIPSPPSYFSPGGPRRRQLLAFLSKFAADISQPITKGDAQHIEYVPTQVFTEFVRHIMKTPDGARIHGIRYLSSKNRKPCCVIFAIQAECLPEEFPEITKLPQILEFVPGLVRTIKIH
jgi:hypothetical protein